MPTARTVIIRAHGGPEVFELAEREVPAPAAGEVTIEQHAAGLNFIDVYQRSGLYPMQLPAAMGMEAAGVVTAVGEGVVHLRPGDRVAYAANPPGAYAAARTMPAAQVCPLPDGISFDEGAAMMLKGMTVVYLFRRTVPIARGDTVLFHAAAGGVGLIACQWARDEGIRLIGTAGSEEKCRLALEHGASACINYRSGDFVARVRELTGGKGVDVVMDSVGATTFDGSLSCLRPLGMMISFGSASGKVSAPWAREFTGRTGTSSPSAAAVAARRSGSSSATKGRAVRRASQARTESSPPIPAGSPIVSAKGAVMPSPPEFGPD
jgi:NADPH2:quinone reductase